MNWRFVREPGRSNVLLTELVIVVLFFALTAATAMQLFIGAHTKSRHTALALRASVLCQDWAERLGGERDMAGYLLENGFEMAADGTYWLRGAQGTVRAAVRDEEMAAGTLRRCEIGVLGDGDAAPLFALSVAGYIPDEEVGG